MTGNFSNTQNSHPIHFQQRDESILRAIQSYDGMLTRRQIKAMFWQDASNQAMERRLSLLFHNHYLNWPNLEQRRTRPIPESIIWLGWRGILHLAEQQTSLLIGEPKNDSENQMRMLEARLRKVSIYWLREPNWNQLAHDIAINDFRMQVQKAVSKLPSITMEPWQTEGTFRRDMDIISYEFENRSGQKEKMKHGVRPDGFFTLVDHLRQINNQPAKARFLVEYDNSTHPLYRFGKQKALPGLNYIRSQAYRNRFGFNSGRWLVICKSETRLEHLKSQTEYVIGKQASNFLFSIASELNYQTVLTSPVWHLGASNSRVSLVNNIGSMPE